MTAQLKPITGIRESVEGLNGEITEYSYVTPDEETMRELTRLLFEEHSGAGPPPAGVARKVR